ncbi:hypothetical protein Y032_0320g2411 [Ancylostoma ceylanicum]|uniref:Fungal lipase-type domain-containing protein n=1 Tax=Ancylostoma ceylanicum TaxID=53326 RepID=A0A016S1S7_9BILA|nr:hypothetical protein Y032_0320g2411 [Ancylostoma ceylanicum]
MSETLAVLHSKQISGHSLGGALATLAASNLVQLRVLANADKVKLVTFGQPRVGDQAFAKAVDDQVCVLELNMMTSPNFQRIDHRNYIKQVNREVKYD